MKILLNLSYVGTAYCGYQVQKNAVSIQQRLNEAAKALFGFECDIVGCSRTDKGVHAKMFCATVSERGKEGIASTIPEGSLPAAFNSYLPGDIVVRSAKYVEDSFHARYDVKYKEYVYRIYNAQLPDPFLCGRVWHYPRSISDDSLAKMNEAASFFVGALLHDDIQTVARIAAKPESKGKPVVVGGGDPLKTVFMILLAEAGTENLIAVPDEVATLASNYGAMRVYEAWRKERR